MKVRSILLCSGITIAALVFAPIHKACAQTDQTVTQYINPLIGTGSVDQSSLSGATFPGAALPFGMVQLSPDTRWAPDGWCPPGYDYNDRRIYGFSHTHLSGTGCAGLYDILVMPLTSSLEELAKVKNADFSSAFSHDDEEATVGYYSVRLKDSGVKAELTATTRTGMHRYTFPSGQPNIVLFDPSHMEASEKGRHRIYDSSVRLINDTTLVGFHILNDWQRLRKCYFYATFNRPVRHNMMMNNSRRYYDNDQTNGQNCRIFLQFDEAPEPLLVKVAISPNSIENARENVAENPGWDFDSVHQKAVQAWEKEMDNIRIDATEDQKVIFYTGLYHAYLQPNIISDLNGDYMRTDYTTGRVPQGQVHQSTFSLWDTYRACHPLYTLLRPQRVPDMVRSMLRQYDTYGYLPIWQLWGTENYTMIGNHAIPVLVDAALKGIAGEDINRVYEAVKGSSLREHWNSPFSIWEKYGYMPENLQTQSVSITLEMAYDDACVARLAKHLGKTQDYERFNRRAHFYRNLFDKQTGFFRAKDDKGNWITPFDPLAYGGNGGFPFTEGNAWQYLWYVPQDVDDFVSLFGGEKEFTAKLDTFFTLTTDNREKNGNASGFIGQYAHGNEPSQHCAYLYDYVGKPERTAYYVNKVMQEQYKNSIGGYSGNDDCGQMSAWYILSAMGFYPTDPASGRYDFGSPLLRRVEIALPDGKKFVITTNRKGSDDYVIKKVLLNGQPLKQHFITHAQILAGGTLQFQMGKK